MDATGVASILGDFTGANFDGINTLNREFNKKKAYNIILKEKLEQVKRQHEYQITNLVKIYDERYTDLQVKNVSLQDELQKVNTTNATLAQNVNLLEKQYEDETASAASSSFSKFSEEEFKEMALQTNREHHDLVNELFKTLDNIFETHVTFDKMSFSLEDLVEKRQ